MMEEELFDEGQRALNSEKKDARKNDAKRLDIDVRKMIIYSELLKPKFDEDLN